MITLFTILIVVSGFTAILYLFLNHISRLEVLIKSKDLQELKNFEHLSVGQTVLGPKYETPDELQDAIIDKDPDEIRDMFKKSETASETN